MIRRRLAISFVLILSGCAAHNGDGNPITIARPAFGGEAGFYGSVELQRGCIVTGGDRPETVLFDPDVTLTDDRSGIRDGPDGAVIFFGRKTWAGAAGLREGGKGWSIADIEEFFGVIIPKHCPTNEVVRLHDFQSE